MAESITHYESGNKYPKNEVFVVDDIYELIESVMKGEGEIKDGME